MRYLMPLLAITLSGCAGTVHLNRCKFAEQRRLVYTTTIAAANAYEASGRMLPYEVSLGRQAALVALDVLNASCPVLPAQPTPPGPAL